MQKIEIITRAEEARNFDFSNKIAIIIDVLRASTTITTLLEKGVKDIIPVVTVEEALNLKGKTNREKILLVGERNGIKPDRFDYGNSPSEINKLPIQTLENKSIVLTTTNGTKAINYSKNADTILIASMRNLYTVIDFLSEGEKPIVIVCSGTNSQFTIEDFYTGGIIVKNLLNLYTPINDITWLAATIAKNPIKDIVNPSTCSHLKKLITLGFKKDIEFAFETGKSKVLPVYLPKGNIIINKQSN